jgi:hypothetical protein
VGDCFRLGGAGAGQVKRAQHLRRRPELGEPNNKLIYSVTAGVMSSRLAKAIFCIYLIVSTAIMSYIHHSCRIVQCALGLEVRYTFKESDDSYLRPIDRSNSLYQKGWN